ncbi:MAG: hypothetical protein HC787_07735 [Nostocaceae cyanobacterium CSU_2_110]|nr:hypothetical protein [Nostocaceae cyanobacterium CSU_2_110]
MNQNQFLQTINPFQNKLFRLAKRLLVSVEEAEDATQEILVLVVTHLNQFEARAQFSTWMYTIATRVLLRTRKRQAESAVRGAQAFAEWLDEHLEDAAYTPAQEAELKLLEDECRLSCTQGMLCV